MVFLASGLTATLSYVFSHIFLTLHKDPWCRDSTSKASGDKVALWEMNTAGRRMLYKKLKGSASDVEEPGTNIWNSQKLVSVSPGETQR